MKKKLITTICYLLIWLSSGVCKEGWDSSNIILIITGAFLGLLGGIYMDAIYDMRD